MTKRAEPHPSTPTGGSDAGRSNVVALSRYRARLARGRRLRRPQELLEAPDAPALIAQLPGDELYYVLRAADREDALQLLVHASAEQVQTVLDFEVWDRDHLSRAPVLDWLDLLSHAPYEKIGEWLRGMDVELLALLLRRSCRIYDLTLEEAPDEPEGTLFPTPDGFFVLDVIGFRPGEISPADLQAQRAAPDAVRAVLTLVDALYRTDLEFARRLLVGARSDQDAELEEHAYRWRSGRMSDLGFIDYYEALEIYRELDPNAVAIGNEPKREVRDEHGAEALRAPDALIERLMTDSPFARAVAALDSDQEIAATHAELIALANRMLAAERVAPGDEQAIEAAMEALSATLDLGVEFLARGDENRAVAAVRHVPLTTIFRTAISMADKLRRLALALKRRNPFAMGNAAVDLFEDTDREVIATVTRLRPLFPRILDEPPRGGQRPFGSLHDLARATAAVERAGASLALLFGLGVRPFHLTAEALGDLSATAEAAIDAGVIARTAVVGRVLHDEVGDASPYEFRPLVCADVKRWRELAGGGPSEESGHARLKEPLRSRALAVLRAAVPEQVAAAAEPVLLRWFDSLAPLEPVLVRAR